MSNNIISIIIFAGIFFINLFFIERRFLACSLYWRKANFTRNDAMIFFWEALRNFDNKANT